MGRFRARLVEQNLWDQLLAEINRQLDAKNSILREGRINIIDATPIEAAQSGSGNGKDGTISLGLARHCGVAVREGFEPSKPFDLHTFQACSFDHSDTSPLLSCRQIARVSRA